MTIKIHPLFEDFGITYQEKLSKDAIDIPVDHPAYKDIWRRIDEYTDKYYLAKKFEEDDEEGPTGTLQKKLELHKSLLKWNHETGLFGKVYAAWTRYEQEMKPSTPNERDEVKRNFFLYEIYKIDERLTPDYVACFNMNTMYRAKDCEKELHQIESKIDNGFATAIREKYPFECDPDNRIELELETQADLIIKDKNLIKNNFQEMHRNTKTDTFEFYSEPTENDKISLTTCELLEKHFGLRHNTKNGIYYISNGEGMYVPFDKTNLDITYAALRDKFKIVYKDNNDKWQHKQLIWKKSKFYNVSDDFCIVETESEADIISFPNCCYDSKTKVIHQFDYRLPRLPMKSCKVNFVFDRDLTGKGGALEEILNYCFDEESRDIIFQYYGRALFERGFTETQEVLLVLGKGNVGKTTFFNTISKIFNKVPTISSSTFSPDNEFAFGELPGCDFFVMDEITASKKGFVDKVKEFTGGTDSIVCNKKYKTPIHLDSEYIPRCIMTGNELPYHIYKESAGTGVLRRFPIIFLEHSILEAKKLTATITIDGEKKEYPAVQKGKEIYLIPNSTEKTDDGEAIGQLYKFEDNKLILQKNDKGEPLSGTQGRTNFTIKELENKRSLEWFLQQVILRYQPSIGTFFTDEESKERFLKAYNPEEWVISKCVEVHFDGQKRLANYVELDAEELLKEVHKIVDQCMLEKTIFDPYSNKILDIIRKTKHVEPSIKESEGKRLFLGLSFNANNIDN